MKFESKKICESSSEKKKLSRERENADKLCYQSLSSLHQDEASIQSSGSSARLIEGLERQLSSASYDNSEFLFRRLDEYEGTLATLSSGFCKNYG